ncbi:MAG: FtsX-like permease family protein [Planctomycetota bacterium]
MYRWFLAVRYLLQRPINLLGVLGVTLSVWALIVVVAIFSGYISEVRRHIHGTTADVSVFNLPRDCPFGVVRELLTEDPNVSACAPRIVWSGMLHPVAAGKSTTRIDEEGRPTGDPVTGNSVTEERDNGGLDIGDDSPFLHLIGIEPEAEMQVSGLAEWLAATTDAALRIDPTQALRSAEPAGAASPPGILLSERRAARERLERGSEVQVTCARLFSDNVQTVDTSTMKLRLQGAYTSRFVLFDASTAFVHIDSLRHLLGSGDADACNVVAVKLRDPSQDRATAERIERRLREALNYDVFVQDWEATNAMFLSAVDHQRSLMKLVLFVIMVVAAFLMFATLSMMVTEKEHDIGILTAMGATRLGVLDVFLTCGLAIVVTGVLLGIVTGCVSAVYLDSFNEWLRATFSIDLFPVRVYNLRHVPYELDPTWIAQVGLMALGVGVLVSGVPAWRAARHDPVDALRCE